MFASVDRIGESLPALSLEEKLCKIENCEPPSVRVLLADFIQQDTETSIILRDLTGAQRASVHSVCKELHLKSESSGKKGKRELVISTATPGGVLKENFVFSGYISLKGAFVDFVAKRDRDTLPEQMIKQRIKRDGERHHITLFSKAEIREIMKQKGQTNKELRAFTASFLQEIAQEVPDNWEDLGLGTLKQDGSQTFYRVLRWPQANLFRHKLGFGDATFHITVGFDLVDIHKRKGPETIIIPFHT